MKEIYLIRHTKPNVAQGICYGQTDLDVSDDFYSAAALVEKILPPKHEIDFFYSSPLKRCAKLAEYLSSDDKNIITDKRLMELNFGEWELKKWEDIPRHTIEDWCEDYEHKSSHGGETFNQLYTRTVEFWEEKIIPVPQKSLIVTHAGVIRSLLGYVLEIPKRNLFSINLEYAQVVQICVYSKENFRVKFM